MASLRFLLKERRKDAKNGGWQKVKGLKDSNKLVNWKIKSYA